MVIWFEIKDLIMKIQTSLLLWLLPSLLLAQFIPNSNYTEKINAPCPYDNLQTTLQLVDWEIYQTINDEWDGVIDSTLCIPVRDSLNRTYIDLDEFDITKPLFVRSAIDETNKIFLDSNMVFSFNSFFYVSDGLTMDLSDQCPGELCTGVITSIQIPDETGTGFNHRIAKNQFDLFGIHQSISCAVSEDFEENYLREFVIKLKVDETSATNNAWINLSGAWVEPAYEIAKIWDLNVPDFYFNGTTYDAPLDALVGNWWVGTYLLRYHDGIYPNASNPSYNKVAPLPNTVDPQVINIEMYNFLSLQAQPFTTFIGGFVEGSDSVRHELNLVNEGEMCLNNIAELIFEEDTHFVHAGGHVDFGEQSCMMFRNNGSLKVAEGETFYYGHNGRGLLAFRAGGTIELTENSTLVIDNKLVLIEEELGSEDQQIYMELNPSTKLAFGEHASITSYSIAKQMKLNIYMNGGELDERHLSPADQLLINKIYPPASPNFVKNIKVFPNPIDHELTLSYFSNINETIELQVISIDGKLIRRFKKEVQPGENKVSLIFSDIASGMYLLQISNEMDVTTMKVLKE